MTPKEKAKELISKMLQYQPYPEHFKEKILINNAKQCALICVDEILETHTNTGFEIFKYWQEVKKEIEYNEKTKKRR